MLEADLAYVVYLDISADHGASATVWERYQLSRLAVVSVLVLACREQTELPAKCLSEPVPRRTSKNDLDGSNVGNKKHQARYRQT